ncbi:hypothetical protein FEK35_23935 [Nocardia cyriacigeorgica]|uniref:Uncharacterized protein n=1 Tax=Nocardia cyriacigeorgica TaxID=135487 RepID=A0A5R8P7W1_9NOCA|nr:hypothetical protein [Nocardia cyriacigeorgica]TLG00300.1 hypothetical protein FEK35_23935 [Nocardia cyriacigeorgica]
MAVVWTDTAEALWRHYLNRVAWGAVYADSVEPGDFEYAVDSIADARAQLCDYLDDVGAHPATLDGTDYQALLTQLIDMGTKPNLKVKAPTIRSAVEQLVAIRRPSRWSVSVGADPVAVPRGAQVLELESDLATVLRNRLPVHDIRVRVPGSVKYVQIGFTLPVQTPAQADITIIETALALVSSGLIRPESLTTSKQRRPS